METSVTLQAALLRAVVCATLLLPAAGATGAGALAAKTVAYRCQDGTTFDATFDNESETLTLAFKGDAPVVLKQAISGSGFRYEGGGIELYGKADWANVVRPGVPELRCQETEAPAPAAPGSAP